MYGNELDFEMMVGRGEVVECREEDPRVKALKFNINQMIFISFEIMYSTMYFHHGSLSIMYNGEKTLFSKHRRVSVQLYKTVHILLVSKKYLELLQ